MEETEQGRGRGQREMLPRASQIDSQAESDDGNCATSPCQVKRSILVQMVSAAGTGYCFNAKRSRLRDKLVLRKHDPRGSIREDED
ncbi:large ribosomal subunit protein bL33m isoform X2 [Mobula birostris]|uniref:large ribosomal subunit protein bL33m isoform X2 n=1 Tax=Mobula birostris TaxID=1983395 RepID=UPI003B2844C8